MASGKTMQAIITLAGKIDPSLEKAVQGVEKKLKGLSKLKSVGGAVGKVGSTMAKGLAVAGSAVASAGAVAASAAGAIGTAALQSYSQYEQLVGGIETLFGTGGKSVEEYAQSIGKTVSEAQSEYDALMASQKAVFDNASQAYKTAGVSANTYMEQATAFSASLVQSLGGDTQAAAQYADLAIKDMSDNANKMGTDISSIQQTYQSLMRGNYAMLDNLKLGYGGTKTELERLVKDASELTGQALDPSKFSDVITAIHAVQDNLGITGTTALEAATTIEGSVNTAKAAWSNWLTGLGRDDADMGELTDQLIESISSVASNVGPVIQRIARSLAEGLPEALASAAQAVAPAVSEVLAGMLNTAFSTLGLDMQVDPQVFIDMFNGISDALAPLAETIFPAIQGFIETVWPSLSNFVETILPPLLEFLSQLGATLLTLGETILPPILDFLTPIVEKFTELATWLLEQLSQAFDDLQGPISTIQGFFEGVAGVVQDVVTWVGNLIGKLGEVGDAIANSPIGQFVGGAVSTIGGFLGFARGGFTSGPYIAGEDPRYPNEAVISFNPAYRAQNLRYWQMAGHMLGAYSATAAPVTAASAGGGTVIDMSGMTFSPRVEVRGNASRDDIVAAIRQCEGEFLDFVEDALARRAEVAYA